jgi:hypothetical protein
MSNFKRTLSESTKKQIAGRQGYKCANFPGSNLERIGAYKCILWKLDNSIFQGNFDITGYDIDHITEFCKSGNDSPDNLQALCKTCHMVKTRNFMTVRTKKPKKTKKNNIDNSDVIRTNNNECFIDSNNNSKDESNNDSDNESNNDSDNDSDNESNNDSDNESNNDSDNESNSDFNNEPDISIDESNPKLKNDIKKQHKKIIAVPSFICNTCDRAFSTQQNLNYHINHNACRITNFACKYCKKQFTAYSNMHRHVKTTCKEKKKTDKIKEDILQKLMKDQEKINKEREKDHGELLKLKVKVKRQSKQLKEKQLKKLIKIDN